VVKSDVNESDDADQEDESKIKHPSPSSTPLMMLRSSTQRERTTEVNQSKEPLQTLKAFFEEDEQSSIKPNESSMDVA